MISKILKYELGLLFFLTFSSFCAFYFQERLPDNFLEISSFNDSMNVFTYYISSVVSLCGFFVGPWVFFPFFIYALLYTFLYSTREYYIDSLNVLFITIFSLCASYLFYPLMLGDGLKFIIQNKLNDTVMFLALPLSLIGFLASTFRESFFEKCNKGFFVSKKYIINKWALLLSKVEDVKFLKFDKKFKTQNKTKSSFTFRIIPQGLLKRLSRKKKLQKEEASTSDKTESIIAPKENVTDELQLELEVVEKKAPVPLAPIKTVKDSNYFQVLGSLKLNHIREEIKNPGDEYFDQIIDRIESKLKEFKIEGLIINILKGPVVDTFELELGPGVKVSKVTNHSQDLSLALYGAPIRIVYPMKGRTTLGIEVPRNPREIIYLEDILESRHYKDSHASLPLTMGKDAFGEVSIMDLASMPHMLVAGATGAGKSVFVNTILVSLLMKKSPKDLRLVLIDPKQLELVLYSSLPHLALPVVTEAKIASLSLMWACQEMERRYSILKEMGVRNIDGFNKKLSSASDEEIEAIRKFYKPEEEFKLPYLVIIIDEFADLILTKAGKEIENNICRLAAKARAAGIHLIIATQRPSVDVITGLIKSNFPTRVSFRVTTSIDSRTILNSIGAELLLGKGDMLYKAGVETMRIHSAFVNEKQIEKLTNLIGEVEGQFNQDALDFLENEGADEKDPYAYGSHISSAGDSSEDDLYGEAVKVVMEQRAASASMLQRRLRIGYNRAANLIDEMEQKGIVGAAQGSKPRKVLSGGAEASEY
ncbi:MAG: DNA translocase FtsK [Bacteriovoracaceae bacterium]